MFKDCISVRRWVEHFKSVLREEDREISYPADSLELLETTYLLRPGKSTGYNSVSNEMIKCLVEASRDMILKLINLVFDNKTNLKDGQWQLQHQF